MNKLYDPDKCNSFQMQFGFEAPIHYDYERNFRNKIRRYENERNSRRAAIKKTSLTR